MYRHFAKRALSASASVIIGLLLSTGALATIEQQVDDEQEQITLNMRGADITAVIQWIADLTNKQIILDPRVRGKITVLANKPMTVDQAYQDKSPRHNTKRGLSHVYIASIQQWQHDHDVTFGNISTTQHALGCGVRARECCEFCVTKVRLNSAHVSVVSCRELCETTITFGAIVSRFVTVHRIAPVT